MSTNEGGVEQEVEQIEGEIETLEGEPEETQDTTDWKAKYEETIGRLKRAETKLEKSKIDKKVEEKVKEKTSELDDTQLDYFDLKGYSDPEEVSVFHKIMLKTGMSAREVLKDDYALAKVKALRDEKAVKEAIPSSTRRSGEQSGDLESAIAKFDKTGELPTDYALKTKVVNAVTDRGNPNKPAWQP